MNTNMTNMAQNDNQFLKLLKEVCKNWTPADTVEALLASAQGFENLFKKERENGSPLLAPFAREPAYIVPNELVDIVKGFAANVRELVMGNDLQAVSYADKKRIYEMIMDAGDLITRATWMTNGGAVNKIRDLIAVDRENRFKQERLDRDEEEAHAINAQSPFHEFNFSHYEGDSFMGTKSCSFPFSQTMPLASVLHSATGQSAVYKYETKIIHGSRYDVESMKYSLISEGLTEEIIECILEQVAGEEDDEPAA
jgi:hypothetical protein